MGSKVAQSSPPIDEVKKGDLVGFVMGPGEHCLNDVWEVVEYYESRWGKTLVVENCDERLRSVHQFVDVGVGCYYLGTPVNAHKVKIVRWSDPTQAESWIVVDKGECKFRAHSSIVPGKLTLVDGVGERVGVFDDFKALKAYVQPIGTPSVGLPKNKCPHPAPSLRGWGRMGAAAREQS